MWYTKTINETVNELRTNINFGLNEEDVKRRKEKFGKNKLAEPKKESIIIRFIKQFNDFMIITLIIAAIISAIISYIQKTGEYIDSIIIIAIVVYNSIMGLLQEYKAEKSIEALKKMAAPVAKVRRNGKTITIPGEDVVIGDILILEAGNFVPADCRLIKSFNLKIEESSLTGETVPVEKNADIILKPNIAIGDSINMAFSSTIVTSGHGEGIVTEVGMNTKVGNIARMIATNESPETPLQRKLRRSW